MDEDSSADQPSDPKRSNNNNSSTTRNRRTVDSVLAKNRLSRSANGSGPTLAPGAVSVSNEDILASVASNEDVHSVQQDVLAKNRGRSLPGIADANDYSTRSSLNRDTLAKNNARSLFLAPGAVAVTVNDDGGGVTSSSRNSLNRDTLAKNNARSPQAAPGVVSNVEDDDDYNQQVLAKNRRSGSGPALAGAAAVDDEDGGQVDQNAKGINDVEEGCGKEDNMEQATVSLTSSTSASDSNVKEEKAEEEEEEHWYQKKYVMIVGGLLLVLMIIGIGIGVGMAIPSKSSSPSSSSSVDGDNTVMPNGGNNDNSTTTPPPTSEVDAPQLVTISVLIQMDDKPSETSWTLSCNDNHTFLYSKDYTEDKDSNHLVFSTHSISLPPVPGEENDSDTITNNNCLFTIRDSGGNGITNGYFEIFLGDDVTKHNNIMLVNKTETNFSGQGAVPFALTSNSILPPPTASPTAVKHLSPYTDNHKKIPITLTLQLDEYPEHTGWSLVCGGDDDKTIIATVTPRTYFGRNSELITETYNVVENDICTFTIIDTFGNGLTRALFDGQEINGFYTIYQGTEIFSNPESTLALQTNFHDEQDTVTFKATKPLGKDHGNRIALSVRVQLDEFPSESSWTLECNNGDILYGVPPFVYAIALKLLSSGQNKFVDTIYVEEGSECIFTMRDLAGDGFGIPTTDIFGTDGFFLSGYYALVVGNSKKLIYLENTFVSNEKIATINVIEPVKPATNRNVPISVVVKYDEYAKDIGWTLTCGDDNMYYAYTFIGDYGEGDNNEIYKTTTYVPSGTKCQFVMTDASSDGICCSHGEGYYEIYNGIEEDTNRTLLTRGGQFTGYQDTVNFGVL